MLDEEERMRTSESHRTCDGPSLPPKQRTHSEDGVDLTLIRWMLSLTPAERLQFLQENVEAVLRLRGGEADS